MMWSIDSFAHSKWDGCRTVWRTVLLSLCLISSLNLFAQEKKADAKGVEFRVLTFERAGDLRVLDLISADGGGPVQEVKMHKNNFTGPYKSQERVLKFARPGSDAEKPEIVARIKLPDNLGSKVLLIAFPGSQGAYQFKAISDIPAKQAGGHQHFFNLTRKDIAGKLAGKQVRIAAGGTQHTLDLKIKDDRQIFPVEFYQRRGEEWNLFLSASWLYEKEVSNFTFFYPSEGRVRVTTIPDFPPYEEEEGDEPEEGS